MKAKPRLLITLGDVAGIGPEVVAKAWPDLTRLCQPIVIGDVGSLSRAAQTTFHKVVPIERIDAAKPTPQYMPCLQATTQDLSAVPLGQMTAAAGQAAYDFLCTAIDLTLAGKAAGIVTMPLNKEGLHAAGLHYPGHTEILAEKTGVKEFGMMLYAPAKPPRKNGIGVVHVTLHMALRDVFQHITTDAVLEKIRLIDAVMNKLCDAPHPRPLSQEERLAVCALNPHASDGGIFGDEEARIIAPAIARARDDGINVVGPLPSDTLFVQAQRGAFDGIVAMYHDQGHIALKLMTGLAAVNITLGLPIVRTSVAHGTAYDIAGQGIARHQSLIEAVRVAVKLTKS
jgi:4-hydroxythreonine-4-phosphate dehydrogenase